MSQHDCQDCANLQSKYNDALAEIDKLALKLSRLKKSNQQIADKCMEAIRLHNNIAYDHTAEKGDNCAPIGV